MPVAYWCILVAALLPLALVAYAKSSSRDNNAPRDSAESLSGNKRRAYAAHQNGFEAFPFFAIAVVSEMSFGVATITLNVLAVLFIVFRIVHAVMYITDRPSLRSAFYGLGLLTNIAIFMLPVLKINFF